MQTATATLNLRTPAAVAARRVGARRVPALRVPTTTRCQASVAAPPKPEEAITISFDSRGKPVVSLGHPAAAAAPAAVPAAAPAADENAEIAELADQFNIWNAALQTGDPEKVAALYAPDGVLLPTVSNKVRTDHAGKVDYFTAFLKIKPFGVIDHSIVRFLSPDKDVGSNSGVYTFTITRDGKQSQVQARYSFVYRKINGVWKIIEHHSSAMPEPVAEPLEEVADQFNIWNAALQTGDPEKVAALYAPDGVLLPTVSNQVRTDHAGKVDYFTAFLKLKPFGVINESHVRFLNAARTLSANSGVYTFDLVKDGQPTKVQARYSFIYRKIDGQWKIAEHHSSAMPEPVVAAEPAVKPAQKETVVAAA